MTDQPMYHHKIIVLQMPLDVPRDFCFGRGLPVQANMVDWFDEPPPGRDLSDADVLAFVRGKHYVNPGRLYVVLRPQGAFSFWGGSTDD